MTKPLLLAFAAGCIVGLVVVTSLHDWSMAAHAGEKKACEDKSPEFRAVMARLPGESHSAESCLQTIRFGSKEFVPEFGLPLPPDKVKPMKPKSDAEWQREYLDQLGRPDGHATR